MRITRTIRSGIVITALASVLFAQNAPTSMSGTVARLYDPPAFYTSAIVNGQVTVLVVRFSTFGRNVTVTPFFPLERPRQTRPLQPQFKGSAVRDGPGTPRSG